MTFYLNFPPFLPKNAIFLPFELTTRGLEAITRGANEVFVNTCGYVIGSMEVAFYSIGVMFDSMKVVFGTIGDDYSKIDVITTRQ